MIGLEAVKSNDLSEFTLKIGIGRLARSQARSYDDRSNQSSFSDSVCPFSIVSGAATWFG